jgi:hypothetical protein
MYLPSSDNAFLSSLIESLRKRHKALKHKTRKIACDKVIEEHDGERIEKLEFAFRSGTHDRDLRLRAFVWEDRWVWIDCRVPGKMGLQLEWSYDGRLLPSHDGRAFITALEATMSHAYSVDAVSTSGLDLIWSPLLARGPKRVA